MYILKKQVLLSVRLRILGKEKQKRHFINADMNNEKVQVPYYDTGKLSELVLKCLKISCEEVIFNNIY